MKRHTKLTLVRSKQDERQTTGYLLAETISLVTMELPWRNNERRISCIPAGTYKAKRHNSPTFGECFWLQDVPNRSAILIHKGNYNRDTLGCILVGIDFNDINKDGVTDIVRSGEAMNELLSNMANEFELVIVDNA